MKVILLDEIKGKGGEGDVVEVAQGYAENFLFPKKLADAGGHLVQAVLLAVDDDGVTGVVAARVAHDGIEVAGD